MIPVRAVIGTYVVVMHRLWSKVLSLCGSFLIDRLRIRAVLWRLFNDFVSVTKCRC